MQQLQHDLGEIRDMVENDRDNEELQRDLRIAELRLEFFRREHDNAGVFKFNRFGRKLRDLFEANAEGEAEIEVNEKGELELSERAANRRMIVVNMGELDRFNKEGGHAAGDAGLGMTAHTIERVVIAELSSEPGETSYQMTRFSGNEFMVSLDGVSEAKAQQIMARIEEQRPSVEGVSEGAPLTADSLSLSEAAEIFNALQSELPEGEKLNGPEEMNHELVEVVKRLGGFRLEVGKFVGRTQRVLEIMGKNDPEQARAFFDNYMAKMFRGTGMEGIDDFERLSGEGDLAWDHEIDRLALEAARRRYADQREFTSVRDDIISRRIKELGPKLNPLSPDDRLQSPEDRLAVIPEFTRGHQAVAEKKRQWEEMPEQSDAKEREIAKLEWQTEDARRDRGTGLMDRGSYYERLEQSIEQKEDVAVVFVDMGFLKYFDQKGGSGVGDDALKAAAEIMEEAVRKSGVSGEVYRYGGDEFMIRVGGGDMQIEKVIAEIQKERDGMGKIPGDDRSAPEYAPTKLSFNYGACDRELFEAVHDDLVTMGHESSDLDANRQAELMTLIADRSIEEEKAVDRFQLLIRELRTPAYADDPNRKSQVDALVAYSQKAIFSETGGGSELKRIAENLELQGAELDEEVRDAVAKHIELRRQAEEGKDALLDRLTDLHVQIKNLSDRLTDMEIANADQTQTIAKLRERLEKAEADRQEILNLKSDLES